MTTIASRRALDEDPSIQALTRLEMLRLRVSAAVLRWRRWEFWPSWIVYAPLIPYIVWLAVRHRGLTVCTRANPGIPLGGIMGESKWNILKLLPQDRVVATTLIPPALIETRLAAVREAVEQGGWAWPIILKPDVGERGKGVSVVGNLHAAREYLMLHPAATLAQERHPGPFEAGVFYYRLPDQAHGRVLSITDKRFASVSGDGRSSLGTLVWRHKRYRAQAPALLAQLGPLVRSVPGDGQVVPVGAIGNHCRGTLFLDGADLITPELEEAFDSIALRTPGFFFGRFDVRYADRAEFAAGRGFQIVELNGLSSESTNIYDPSWPFWRAQRMLRRQWRLAFEIGAMNSRIGRGGSGGG